MKKERITFDQLALLSFLKFTKLDGLDMTVLMNMIKETTQVKIDDSSDDYYIMSDGIIMLEESFIDRFSKNVDMELYSSLENTHAFHYLDKINMLEFVLRKIRLMGDIGIVKDDISDNFSFLQINTINKLYYDGMVMESTNKDLNYGEYQTIKMTKRGEAYLFLIDNKKAIDNFKFELLEIDYDDNLLFEYLITKDLNESIVQILNLGNFVSFCEQYNSQLKRTLKPNMQ